MTLKEKLLRIWRGDPEPDTRNSDPEDADGQDQHLSRRDLDRIIDEEHENLDDGPGPYSGPTPLV